MKTMPLAEYIEACERGEMPDRGAFLSRHPDLTVPLTAFFDNWDNFGEAAPALAHLLQPTPTENTVAHVRTLPLDEPVAPNGDLGDYELLEKLGEGGMGVVYKARHRQLKRLVALKVMAGGRHAGEEELKRFRIEAEAAARLQHPGIVQIFEIGHHDSQAFLALELCEGGTLVHRMREKPLSIRQAAEMLRELAEAIEAAHRQRVVHRDLKPANVLLTVDGKLKVTDFGLAKKLDEREGLTATNAIVGTPQYMAPEQAAGQR